MCRRERGPRDDADLALGIDEPDRHIDVLLSDDHPQEVSLVEDDAVQVTLPAFELPLEAKTRREGRRVGDIRHGPSGDLLMELDDRSPGQGYDALAFEASERMRARVAQLSMMDETTWERWWLL